MIKKVLKAFLIYSTVSLYLYGLSEATLKNVEFLKSIGENGSGNSKIRIKLVIVQAFENFKKAFCWTSD